MRDFKLDDVKEKLQSLNEDDKLKMVYQWIKQDHITLLQFKVIINEFIYTK